MRDKVYKALKKKEWRSYKDIMKVVSDERYTATKRTVRQIRNFILKSK